MEHYHVYLAQPADGLRRFLTRASDVFRTRSGANAWARDWPSAWRIVRQCDGEYCPSPRVTRELIEGDGPHHRARLPTIRTIPRRRRHVPERVKRIRERLDELDADALARIEALIEEVAAPS